jgi:AcrR family transcriptional regulator
MSNKELQKKRMIGYFKEAVNKIVDEEGIEGLTARKVGERSGYSYATIYNYFSDFKALIALVCLDKLEALALEMTKEYNDPVEAIVESSKQYFEFFASNPDWFRLIFIEDLGNHPTTIVGDNEKLSVGELLMKQLITCADLGIIEPSSIMYYHGLIASSIHGKILFYVYQRQLADKIRITTQIEQEIRKLLEG